MLATLNHEILTWEAREAIYRKGTTADSEGKAAYAAKQALLRHNMGKEFQRIWNIADQTPVDLRLVEDHYDGPNSEVSDSDFETDFEH